MFNKTIVILIIILWYNEFNILSAIVHAKITIYITVRSKRVAYDLEYSFNEKIKHFEQTVQ